MWCRDSTAWPTIPAWITSGRYGATIGRFANRIKDNSYQINHVQYRVTRDAYVLNEAENKPYDERVWDARPRDGAEPQLICHCSTATAPWAFPAPCG